MIVWRRIRQWWLLSGRWSLLLRWWGVQSHALASAHHAKIRQRYTQRALRVYSRVVAFYYHNFLTWAAYRYQQLVQWWRKKFRPALKDAADDTVAVSDELAEEATSVINDIAATTKKTLPGDILHKVIRACVWCFRRLEQRIRVVYQWCARWLVEHLHRKGMHEVGSAVTRHVRWWATLTAIGIVLWVLGQFDFWQHLTRSGLQDKIDDARALLPSDWAVQLKPLSTKFWHPLFIASCVLATTVSVASAYLLWRRRKRRIAAWNWYAVSARRLLPQFCAAARKFVSTHDAERLLPEFTGGNRALFRVHDGALVHILSQLLADEEKGQAASLLQDGDLLHGMMMLAAHLEGEHPAFHVFLDRYGDLVLSTQGAHSENAWLVHAFRAWKGRSIRTLDGILDRFVLRNDLAVIRERFRDPLWVAKYA